MKQKAAMNGFDQSNEKETKERLRLGEVNGIQTSRTLVTNIVQFLGLPDGNNVEKKTFISSINSAFDVTYLTLPFIRESLLSARTSFKSKKSYIFMKRYM